MADRPPWEDFQAPSGGPWEDWQEGGFEKAVSRILEDEGGYVNDPADKGGETKFGISKKAFPDVDIKSLTRDSAKAIYREKYWDELGAQNLPPTLREVAFDAAVNQGVGFAKKALAAAQGDVSAFIEKRRQRYRAIIRKDPTQKRFERGWMARLDRYEGPWNDYRGN